MPLVVKLLAKGQTVRALHRPSSHRQRVLDAVQEACPEALDRLTWCEGDVTDQASLDDALDGVDTVYHCAALVSFHPADAAAMARINADGTAQLVNAMLHRNTPRLVHVSSVAALGRKAGEPTTEDTLFEEQPGTTAYARSKQRAEMEAWRGMAEGLEVIVVNPTIILGDARYGESSGMVFRRAAEGRRHYPAGGGGFVGVIDLLAVCAALDVGADGGQQGILGERFIVSAEDVSHRDIMTWVAESIGVRPPSAPLQGWMLALAWRAATAAAWITRKPPILTRDLARNTQVQHQYDTGKLSRALPDFRFTPIREVIREATRQGVA